jgi:hypothetical protein
MCNMCINNDNVCNVAMKNNVCVMCVANNMMCVYGNNVSNNNENVNNNGQ